MYAYVDNVIWATELPSQVLRCDPTRVFPAVSDNYNLQPLLATQLPPSFDWPAGVSSSIVDGQRWDSWGRLTQALFSTRPHLATIGASGPRMSSNVIGNNCSLHHLRGVQK
jgi:hypothetical protein